MSKSKWMMKQYWRVGTIRTLLSLALGMFVLGKLYYVYIPVLTDFGVWGALILGTFLIFLFLGIGWMYDEKGKMWSPKSQAIRERSAYEYVPNYRDLAFDYPVFHMLFITIRKIFLKLGMETKSVDDGISYLREYYQRLPFKSDMDEAKSESSEFLGKHPFSKDYSDEPGKIGIKARSKLSFEIHMLRLSWVQSLTGMAQDVLVFAAFYVVIIFPEVAVNNVVPNEYILFGIVFISLPLFGILAALGWLYDKRLKVWSADLTVKIERNPFSYVPDPRLYSIVFPFYAALLNILRNVLVANGMDTAEIEKITKFLDEYKTLTVEKDENMQNARDLRASIGELFQRRSKIYED